jgi:hypothetical protein
MNHIYLRIAGFNLSVKFGPAEILFFKKKWIHDLATYYGTFIVHKKPDSIDYTIQFVEQNCYATIYKKNIEDFMIFSIHNKGKTLTTFYIISLFQFETIIMNILSLLVKQNSGFFFHTSASNIKNGIYLFTGASGAGKSTIIHLLQNVYEPVIDDLAVIRKEKDEYKLYQTPRHEKNDEIQKTKNGYTIKKIFFLRKSPVCHIEKITKREFIINEMIQQLVTYEKGDTYSIHYLMNFIQKFNSFSTLSFSLKKDELVHLLGHAH